jgi:hypothetical protein
MAETTISTRCALTVKILISADLRAVQRPLKKLKIKKKRRRKQSCEKKKL